MISCKKFGKKSGVARVQIDRTQEKVTVYIFSARVGIIIGKKGGGGRQADAGIGRTGQPPESKSRQWKSPGLKRDARFRWCPRTLANNWRNARVSAAP